LLEVCVDLAVSGRSAEGNDANENGEFVHPNLKGLDEGLSMSLQFKWQATSILSHEKWFRCCGIVIWLCGWVGPMGSSGGEVTRCSANLES
jgi:hypothetical protein